MRFTRIGVVLKPDLRDPLHVMSLLSLLDEWGATVCIDEQSRRFLPDAVSCDALSRDEIDLLLVLGGDGTILRAVRDIAPLCPILSVHEGTVGFLTEMKFDEVPSLLPKFLEGEGHVEERSLLAVEARRGKELLFSGDVLNEAVISQGSIARLVDLRCEVSGEELTTFRSDGLIIATPTGSTAYSLAAGGPVVHPRLSAIILTPINSQSFAQKPIVLPGGSDVLVEVLPKAREFISSQVSLTLDGQKYVPLERGDLVHVKSANRHVTFLRRREETFLQTLREKLKWGERIGN